MYTKEELIKMREANLRPARERSARLAAKNQDEYEKKQSHDWSRSVHKTQTGAQPMLGNCKKCGVNYYLFKGNPEFCPKKDT